MPADAWSTEENDLIVADCCLGRREFFLPGDLAQPGEGAERLLRNAKRCRQRGGLPVLGLGHGDFHEFCG
jgi:hypothetical protein